MSSFNLESAFGSSQPGTSVFGGDTIDLNSSFGDNAVVAPKPKPKKKGWADFPGSLLGGLESAITGIPAGAQAFVTHPVGTIEKAAHGEAYTWGPFFAAVQDLARGDFAAYGRDRAVFNQRFFENPVPAISDALIPFTAGAGRIVALSTPGLKTLGDVGRAGLLGQLPGERGVITHTLGTGETVTARSLPKSAYRATRMQLTDKALKRFTGPNWAVVGEHARAGRAVLADKRRIWLQHISTPEYKAWQQHWVRMNKMERAVFYWHNRFAGNHADLLNYMESLTVRTTPEAAQTMALLSDPRFLKLFDNPSKKIHEALDIGEKLANSRTGIALRRGAIDAEDAALAPFRHIRMARGAAVLTKGVAHKEIRKIDAQQARIEQQLPRVVVAARKAGQKDIATVINEGRVAARGMNPSQPKKMVAAADRTDALRNEADLLTQALRDTMSGNLTTDVLQKVGIDIPTGTSVQGAIATEVLRNQFEAEIKTAHAEKAALADEAAKLEHTNQTLIQQNPDLAGEWVRHMGARQRELRQKTRAIDERVARAQKDLQDLHGDTMINPRWQEIRSQVMGTLHDRLGAVHEKLQRSMAAEHGLERRRLAADLMAKRHEISKQDLAKAREARITMLQGHRAKYLDLLDQQQLLNVSKADVQAGVGKLQGGGELHDLKAEIAARNEASLAAGGPGVREPFYIPDVHASAARTKFRQPEGSIAPTDWRADVRNSQGILFRHGMLANYPDILTPSYLRMAKHDFYTALHQEARRLATPVARNTQLPDGMEWLKTRYGQSIGPLEQMRGEHLKETGNVYSDLPEHMEITSKDPNLPDNQILVDEMGYRLAVPKQFANQFRSEFSQGSNAMRRMAEYPMTVWRALILHLRVPWLINNILGNTMLTTLRFMGASGLRAALALVAETKGAQGVAKALGMKGVAERMKQMGLHDTDMRDLLPGQIRGTGIGSQMPNDVFRLPATTQGAARAGYRAGAATLGFLPGIDRRVEMGLRRLSANAILHASPEVKRIYRNMPKQERSWREAMRQGLENDPKLSQFVTREINDALGDFLSLSRHERGIIRGFIPFYAWLREITRITAHTAIDTPGRAAVMLKLGQVGAENSAQDVPSYLRGALLGGKTKTGLQKAVLLRAAVPWASTLDVAKAASVLTPWGDREGARALFSNLNPIYAQAAKGLIVGTQGRGTGLGTFLQPGVAVTENLPQFRALFPTPSPLYPDRTQLDMILKVLGDPRIQYQPDVAAQRLADEQKY